MSQENVEVVSTVLRAFDRADYEAALGTLDAEIEVAGSAWDSYPPGGLPWPRGGSDGVYRVAGSVGCVQI